MVSNSHHFKTSLWKKVLSFLYPFQAAAIKLEHLSMSEPTPAKVRGSYKQAIKSNGQKLTLQTSNYHTHSGLKIFSNEKDEKCILIPVDEWLLKQLTTVEEFITSNTTIPSDVSKDEPFIYKPLLLGASVLISVSHWCKYFKYDESRGAYMLLKNYSHFDKGTFNVNIEVSHVFIGPHKGGQHYSASLRVIQIVYKEDQEYDLPQVDSSFLNEVLSEADVIVKKKKKSPKPETLKTRKTKVKGKASSQAPSTSCASIFDEKSKN